MYFRLLLGDFGILKHLMIQQGSGDKSAPQVTQEQYLSGCFFFYAACNESQRTTGILFPKNLSLIELIQALVSP